MNSTQQPEIKLAPPGAGLGFFIELFLRWYVNPFVVKKISWQQCEDSSRYWSVKMLVEHLLIVGTQVQMAILRLGREESMKELVNIAAVKPKGEISYPQLFEKLKWFTSHIPEELNTKVENKESRAKLTHPWFGPFNSKQWYWLLGTHAAIHLKQLKEIKKGLNLKN